jgi:oligopeptide transport system ATP-binding protein
MTSPLLQVQNLSVTFATQEGDVPAVDDLSFTVAPGEVLGVVGESGAGKSQVFLAIMGLLARNGRAAGRVRFRGDDLLGLPAPALNRIRGRKIAMVFQDPMTSLNPFLRIGRQLTEVVVAHEGASETAARKRAIDMLERVRIPDAARRIDQYPHEFSGGMRQRVMLAMALLCKPDLIIADEPTTALDVTVQAQILDLLLDIRRDLDSAIVVISHDFGVIARAADRVMVMYAGRLVEQGSVYEVFDAPLHPYTRGLLASMPRADAPVGLALVAIPGQPPNLQRLSGGCVFAPRCPLVESRCRAAVPPLLTAGPDRAGACFKLEAL